MAIRRRAPLTLLGTFGVCLFLASCAQSPTTPAPTPTPVPVVGPAPTAALKVGSIEPPLMLWGRPGTFDASASSGEALVYHIDFGDGQWTDGRVASHAVTANTQRFTATITVADRHSRTATAQVAYTVVDIDWPLFWLNKTDTGEEDYRRLFLRQNGDALTGSYSTQHLGGFKVTGQLLGDRGFELVSEDGTVRLVGTLEWTRQEGRTLGSASSAVLRIRMVGGPEDGHTFDYFGADPY